MDRMRGWRGWEALRRLLGRRGGGPGERCLPQDATWSVVVRRTGLRVRCEAGLVLLTCEGDVEDHLLQGGATFVATRPGRLAVWALEPSRLRHGSATCSDGDAPAWTPHAPCPSLGSVTSGATRSRSATTA